MTNKDHLIYCFLDENQKPFYIGQTYDLKMRMRAHNQFMVDVEERRPQSKYAYYQKAREILKTGKNVKVKILKDGLTREAADTEEELLIAQYRADPSCKLLNSLNGGIHGQRGKVVSLETREKIRKAKLGKPLSAKHRLALLTCKRKKRIFTNKDRKRLALQCLKNFGSKGHTKEAIEKMRQTKLSQHVKYTKTQRKMRGRAGKLHWAASLYLLTSPKGKKYKVFTLKEASKISGVFAGTLQWAVRAGKEKTKNWKIQKLSV